MGRIVGNVVQSIPFVDANRDNRIELSLRKLLIHLVRAFQSLPSFVENSPCLWHLLDKQGKSCRQQENTKTEKKTQEMQSKTDTRSNCPPGKEWTLHYPPESNCLVCSAPHAVTVHCYRFFGGLANSSRATTCAVVVVVSGFTPTFA